ncbi:unnamed protein product [Protopolystoma xenopodis]|uniref:Uncharacterized protein n=1 Tax=Protopolystoma xenopodis TaxID=117903 RepID=A0A448XN15_9PLAT|nr:unnamed protein product [Protopolystoma xenopodis]
MGILRAGTHSGYLVCYLPKSCELRLLVVNPRGASSVVVESPTCVDEVKENLTPSCRKSSCIRISLPRGYQLVSGETTALEHYDLLWKTTGLIPYLSEPSTTKGCRPRRWPKSLAGRVMVTPDLGTPSKPNCRMIWLAVSP